MIHRMLMIVSFFSFILFSCSNNPQSVNDKGSSTGNLAFTINVEASKQLSKTKSIELNKLSVVLSAADEKDKKYTYSLNNNGTQTFSGLISNLAVKKWTIKAFTIDSKGYTIHEGESVFLVNEDDTAFVNLVLPSKFIELDVSFYPLRENITRCQVSTDYDYGDLVFDSLIDPISYKSDTLKFHDDYMARYSLLFFRVYGLWEGKETLFYQGFIDSRIESGTDYNHKIELSYIGPIAPIPPEQKNSAQITVTIGKKSSANYLVFLDSVAPPKTILTEGTIDTDSTLKKSGSPYKMYGTITVSENATLTFEPGVKIINSDIHSINIDGGFIAEGTENDSVAFINTNLNFTGKNVKKSKLAFITTNKSYFSSITFNHSAGTMELKNCNITIPITNYTLLPLKICHSNLNSDLRNVNILDSCIINDFSIYNTTDLNIQNSEFYNTSIGISDTAHVTISFSTFNSSFIRGPFNEYDNTACDIFSSRFENTRIRLLKSNDLNVKNCIFIYNKNYSYTYGLQLSNATISKSDISGSSLECYENLLVDSCNFISPFPSYIILSQTGTDITAKNCYWGTTNTPLISKHIFDYYDDITKGKVTFTPVLSKPVTR